MRKDEEEGDEVTEDKVKKKGRQKRNVQSHKNYWAEIDNFSMNI